MYFVCKIWIKTILWNIEKEHFQILENMKHWCVLHSALVCLECNTNAAFGFFNLQCKNVDLWFYLKHAQLTYRSVFYTNFWHSEYGMSWVDYGVERRWKKEKVTGRFHALRNIDRKWRQQGRLVVRANGESARVSSCSNFIFHI